MYNDWKNRWFIQTCSHV